MTKNKIAQALLRQRHPRDRRTLIIKYVALLVLAFSANAYFVNLESPLRLIPQTATTIAIGYFLTIISSILSFRIVAEFIDWEKVTSAATPKP